MSRNVILILIISFLFTAGLAAQDEYSALDMQIPVFKSLSYFGSADVDDEALEIPEGIRNNEFYLESLRLNRLALETYEYGDYDASANFAQEAVIYAELSDGYVANELMGESRRLVEWANSNNIAARYPYDYEEGIDFFQSGISAHSNEEWTSSIDASIRAIQIFTMLRTGGTPPLPNQYTVRAWSTHKDCLWIIAGYAWVYNDPFRWRELYEANKSRMPDPNNPDWIEPGFVLNIPSIRGETRYGMWEPNRMYR